MILTKSKIDKILEKLINHEVVISHIVNNSGERLTTSGILKEVNDEIIVINHYSICGIFTVYNLNRKACL